MKHLLARILCSVAHSMWQKEPNLSRYTGETEEHELNLASHFASELHTWFPWLDYDSDVAKRSFNHARPDIILHRRATGLNFLVVEVKRECRRHEVPADLIKIHENWFAGNLRYRFGAAVILDEVNQTSEAQVLCRTDGQAAPVIVKQSEMETPLRIPYFSAVQGQRFNQAIDGIMAARQQNARMEITTTERELDELVSLLYAAMQ